MIFIDDLNQLKVGRHRGLAERLISSAAAAAAELAAAAEKSAKSTFSGLIKSAVKSRWTLFNQLAVSLLISGVYQFAVSSQLYTLGVKSTVNYQELIKIEHADLHCLPLVSQLMFRGDKTDFVML